MGHCAQQFPATVHWSGLAFSLDLPCSPAHGHPRSMSRATMLIRGMVSAYASASSLSACSQASIECRGSCPLPVLPERVNRDQFLSLSRPCPGDERKEGRCDVRVPASLRIAPVYATFGPGNEGRSRRFLLTRHHVEHYDPCSDPSATVRTIYSQGGNAMRLRGIVSCSTAITQEFEMG